MINIIIINGIFIGRVKSDNYNSYRDATHADLHLLEREKPSYDVQKHTYIYTLDTCDLLYCTKSTVQAWPGKL